MTAKIKTTENTDELDAIITVREVAKEVWFIVGFLLLAILIVLILGFRTSPGSSGSAAPGDDCDLNANTSNFSAQISAATAGQTVCLASGSYSEWRGTNKAITIKPAENATPEMNICFGAGDSDFTLEGMSDMYGAIGTPGPCDGGATNITIKNSTFSQGIMIEGEDTSGIVLDGNTHNWAGDSVSTIIDSKIFLRADGSGTVESPAVTVKNSQIMNGDLDGVFIGGGQGYVIESNEFKDLCDQNVNHTDNIQFSDNTHAEVRIAKNFIHLSTPCVTQAIASFDGGVVGAIIEDNVIDVYRAWCIEAYSDTDSIIRHNTCKYRQNSNDTNSDTHCWFFNIPCGKFAADNKDSPRDDPPGTGTQVYDNIFTTIEFVNGSTGTQHHNMCRLAGCTGAGTLNNATPIFVGGEHPTTYLGFCLAANSPGKNAASDGLDMGIRCPAPPAPNLTDFTITPATHTGSGTSTLSWSSANATSCAASGDWSGSKATTGSQSTGTLSVARTYTYTLTCTGAGGTTAPQSKTVTVSPASSGGGGDGGDNRKLADLNGDGVVDMADLAMLLARWDQTTPSNVADLNDDGKVHMVDLTMLLARWEQ